MYSVISNVTRLMKLAVELPNGDNTILFMLLFFFVLKKKKITVPVN